MSKKIIISKYENNTHYTVHVIDSFGQEHHLGYYTHFDEEDMIELEEIAEEIWKNEMKNCSILHNAIQECIEIDKKSGILSGNRDGLD